MRDAIICKNSYQPIREREMTYVFVIILAAMVVWAIKAFNRLIGLKGQTLNGWKQIDVQLKRRHDLIPNLVNAVKGAMEFEKGTLESVISPGTRP